jgi:hypothetical protein
VYHHAQLLLWGLVNFLPGMSLNHNPTELHFLSKWDYSVSHHTLLFQFLYKRVFIALGYVTRTEISGSYGNFMLNSFVVVLRQTLLYSLG